MRDPFLPHPATEVPEDKAARPAAVERASGEAERPVRQLSFTRSHVEEGLLPEREFLRFLAERDSTRVLERLTEAVLEPVPTSLPLPYLEEFLILPLEIDDDRVRIATALDLDLSTEDEVGAAFERRVERVYAPRAEILEGLRRFYGMAGEDLDVVVQGGFDSEGFADETADPGNLEDLANQAPVIRLVNFLILEAARRRASDIHFEALENSLKVRYRIDGRLQEVTTPPKKLQAAITSRIKIMAELNIAERRLPQDGRIRLKVADRDLDLRISTIPTLHGESVVMRLLDKGGSRLDLEELGMDAATVERFARLIGAPHGVLLVTGPTGSGKTTTLYAALERLNAQENKILTVEDPVEYQLAGINQVPVKAKIGMTFARALRHILRQDPDIVMVGEMRDFETAEIAIQAALTGHLVFSTLHTNDAPTAVTRLIEMGIEDYLVASAVNGILAQRLVRTLCASCAVPDAVDPADAAQALGQDGSALVKSGVPARFRRPVGCPACDGTGYRGRMGIYELLVLDDELRGHIPERSATVLRELGRARGMVTLREDGWGKAARGLTSLEEVLRVTREEEV
ncbi:MAG: type II secretion system ATPase GspE [Gemmatimonadetes bacterium]|nr:type II secretion system ATPase GspE [Gemmatimonadota bacterium]